MTRYIKPVTPIRHVVAFYTCIILLPLVYYIPPWLTDNVSDKHWLVTLLTVVIIVPIVSYVALPLLFKSLDYIQN